MTNEHPELNKCALCGHGGCEYCKCCHNPDCNRFSRPYKACYDQLLPPSHQQEVAEWKPEPENVCGCGHSRGVHRRVQENCNICACLHFNRMKVPKPQEAAGKEPIMSSGVAEASAMCFDYQLNKPQAGGDWDDAEFNQVFNGQYETVEAAVKALGNFFRSKLIEERRKGYEEGLKGRAEDIKQ